MSKKFSNLRENMSSSARLRAKVKKEEHLQDLKDLPPGKELTSADQKIIEEEFKAHRNEKDLASINDADLNEIRKKISVGDVFTCGGKSWKCTDKGQRTIIAIELDPDRDDSWYVGPPYAVAETIFDENDILGIED